jgi:biopolymer transport protein ExbD
MPKSKRGIPEINAGSMADIAFLLLVFFLVTTTMDVPTGIQVALPPITDEPPPQSKQRKREVLEVLINSNDQLLVEGDLLELDRLTEITKTHLTNEGRDPRYATSSTNAIVSLKNDRSTSYEAYIGVYNELQRAYNEVRDEYANQMFGRTLKELEDLNLEAEVKKVKKKYPIKLSEAEPVDVEG